MAKARGWGRWKKERTWPSPPSPLQPLVTLQTLRVARTTTGLSSAIVRLFRPREPPEQARDLRQVLRRDLVADLCEVPHGSEGAGNFTRPGGTCDWQLGRIWKDERPRQPETRYLQIVVYFSGERVSHWAIRTACFAPMQVPKYIHLILVITPKNVLTAIPHYVRYVLQKGNAVHIT
ncbi:hypothetical protein NDU88_004703 [Pleurodeles waltl]|uniref:Uncharacterized protein n=1 Tax=Pleurodeles waltl TaxID=8319 RepID=A0AAV7SJI2_PLEWA|nr:hypothetical protein NDU88_004703 [Pleurodeles waltl]